MDHVVDDIKDRISIVDVVQEYLPLKQAGSNWKGCCPFHNEKTPSFMVSEEKRIFHCFGCHEGGDIFTFIEKMEGIPFSEVLKILADKAGIKLEQNFKKDSGEKTRLMEITHEATRFFYYMLNNDNKGKLAKEYLQKRNLNQKSIDDFKIGFAPNSWDTLQKYLQKKSASYIMNTNQSKKLFHH